MTVDQKRKFARFCAVDSDVDALREHYARTLTSATIHPIAGNATISVEDLHFSLGDFDVWAGSCRSGMDVRFVDAPDAYALYLPLTGATLYGLENRQCHSVPGTLLVCDLTQLRSLHFLPGRSHIGIAFGKNALTQQLSALIDAPVVQEVGFTEMIDAASGTGAKIASMCQFLWEILSDNPEDAVTARSSELFVQTLMTTMLEGIPHRYSALMQGRHARPVPRHVKRAIDFMMSDVARPLGIEEIADAAGVSIRTLQLGFQEFKDMTPLTYLKQLRLDGVRRDLEQGRAVPESIADVARRWGFTHMGRFASLYREAFGETPRMTLAKK